jgi:hypothetical protein
MSIFDIFKRKKKEEPVKNYDFDSLPILIEEELKEINEKSEKFMGELKVMVNNFSAEMKQKISNLKLLNLDKKRKDEDQRLKDIVTTSLRSYISFLERLADGLEKIDSKDVEEYVKKVQSAFDNFKKSSGMIYERATILIGKELAEVRDMIDGFARNFNEKLKSNQENLDRMNLIKSIQGLLSRLEEIRKIQKQIEDSIAYFENKKIGIEEERQSTEKNYDEYKQSSEFKAFSEEQEITKQKNKVLDEDISRLKHDINLKNLAAYFHNDQKKNSIIKNYSRDFSESLKEDSDLEIISLLKEANHKSDEQKIRSIKQRIIEKEDLMGDAKIEELTDHLSSLDRELTGIGAEIAREKEKIPKFVEKQDQIMKRLEETAQKAWVNFKL